MINLRITKVCLFFLVLNTTTMYAQVGIGTTNPQQELHVSGNTSTIRIEGLNSANNANNTGLRDQPVYVNSDGDLKVPVSPANSEIKISNKNFISNGSPVHITTGASGESGWGQIYQSPSFTLTQPAVVYINYAASFGITNIADTAALRDGKPRLVQNYFFIGDGTSPDFSTSYGTCSQTYTSYVSTGSQFIVTQSIINSASDMVILPAGTYSIHLYGLVFASDGVTNLNTSDAFRAKFGTGIDRINVTAFY